MVKVLKTRAKEVDLVGVSQCMEPSVINGTLVHALTARTASVGMSVRHVVKQVSWVKDTRHLLMRPRVEGLGRGRSITVNPCSSSANGGLKWQVTDFLRAHELVSLSGLYNFECCKIPVPTAIRHDRLRAALGDKATAKEVKVLNLLEYGMPINCDGKFGIKKPQKNHFSALAFKMEVGEYFTKGLESQALLGPFKSTPIQDLRFSPLMSVPKETTKRRIIVDFSFPPGKSINDGIPRSTYLDFEVEFSLP